MTKRDLGLAVVTMGLVLCMAAGVGAQDLRSAATGATAATTTTTGDDAASWGRADGRRTIQRLPKNFARGVAALFHRDSVVPLLVGSSLTALGSLADHRVAEQTADPSHPLGTALEHATQPIIVSAAALAVFTASRFSSTPRFRAVSYDWLTALCVNAVYTTALKAAIGRERPNGQDQKSFPSGHSSSAFAVATVAEAHFGWKGGLPAYTLASLVAWSRLQREKHYLSDVLAGATLGYLSGRAVVRVNSRPLPSGRHVSLSITPVLTRQRRGAALTLVY